MPRKPRPPLPNIHIEGLSSGQVVIIDDFTGQPIDQQRTQLAPPKSSAEYVRERKQRELAASQQVLRDAGIIKREPKLVELIPVGKMKIGEFNDMAVLMNKPKWRRV